MRNASIFTLFYKSLYSFKDLALFRFLGIGKTIRYVFFLSLLYFLPTYVKALTAHESTSLSILGFSGNTGSMLITLPIFTAFSYLFYSGLLFLKISVLALVSSRAAILLKRKLPYRQAWRLTTYCITLPTLIFGLEPIFDIHIPGTLYIDLAIALFFIISSVYRIPLPKK